jgi:putative FmdB family regulatory protein
MAVILPSTMPLYDFRCDACAGEFEALAAPGAGAPCPACGSSARRLFRPIAPPARIGLRGAAAARSDATRRAREEQRAERRARRTA